MITFTDAHLVGRKGGGRDYLQLVMIVKELELKQVHPARDDSKDFNTGPLHLKSSTLKLILAMYRYV